MGLVVVFQGETDASSVLGRVAMFVETSVLHFCVGISRRCPVDDDGLGGRVFLK